MLKVPEMYRLRSLSRPRHGNNGAFQIPAGEVYLRVICTDNDGWEHVSVSLSDRTPTWTEMCRVKDLFWDPEDCVLQYHPPKSDYVNCHPYCLHLWRPINLDLPRPPSHLVGPKNQ